MVILISSSGSISAESSYKDTASTNTMSSWHFIALGDSRQQLGTWDSVREQYSHENSSNPIRAALINSIVEDNPNVEFIVHTGDMVASGGEQDDWDRFFEDIENATNKNIPFYYAVGNHEIYTYAEGPGDYGDDDDDFSTYLVNVDLPGNERYYSFNYKNQIHFVFINTEEYWNGKFNITPDQKSWLIGDLENNTIDFVVAVFHRPCYSIRNAGRVRDAQNARSVLEPILLQYDVDLMFSGHDHYYYRTIRNDTTYITTGGAGADLYTNEDLSEWQEGDVYFSEYHYCNVTVVNVGGNLSVNVDTLIFHESNKSTTLGDSFQILAPPAETTTSTTEITQSTITTEKTTSSNITTSMTTESRVTPYTFITTIIGLVVISYSLKKLKYN